MEWWNSYLGLLCSHQHAAICPSSMEDLMHSTCCSTAPCVHGEVQPSAKPVPTNHFVQCSLYSSPIYCCLALGLGWEELSSVEHVVLAAQQPGLLSNLCLNVKSLQSSPWGHGAVVLTLRMFPNAKPKPFGFCLKFIPLHFVSYRRRLLFD